MLLCLALVLGLCPWTFAAEQARPDGTIEVAFFTGGTKDTPTTEYDITYNPESIKKEGTGSGWDRGAHYLETAAAAVGDSVTVTGIDNIPAGNYKVELVYKQGGNRATIKCKLDDIAFAPEVDINSTAAPAEFREHTEFVNTQPQNAGNPLMKLYSYTLAEKVEITGNSHTFTMEAVAGGTINVYGLLLTPIVEAPAITLSDSVLTINLAETTTASVTAEVAEGYGAPVFTSSDEAVAKVAGSGNTAIITAVGVGTAEITATVTNADGTVKTAVLTVSVVNEVSIGLPYSDDAQTVLTVNSSRNYIKLAQGATVAGLLADIDSNGLSLQVVSANGSVKNSGTLTSTDRLVVTRGGDQIAYSLIVMGDTASTDIAAAKTDDTEFGMQGSNIGEISDNGITLIDGKVRRLWVNDTTNTSTSIEINKSTYTGTTGRIRALRTCSEIITQLESANGTKQSYKIVDAGGNTKTSSYPVTGDKLVVTAENGTATREYPITVQTAAVSGQLILSRDTMTEDTPATVVLDYYAGQRSPEAQVIINLPVAVSEEDITINLIGRGDVAFADFEKGNGELDENGYFEDEEMHQVIGRYGSLWKYETLGQVELTNGGKTLKFSNLDLRANNGADLRITIENMAFSEKGDYDFSASFTTAGADVDTALSGLSSMGAGPEIATITVVNEVSDLTRLPYDPTLADPNYTYSEALGGITGLSYLDYSEMGELYTAAYLAWTPAKGVDTVELYQAEGTVTSGGVVNPGNWVKVGTIANSGTYTVKNLNANKYYQFKIVAPSGDSNIVEHYSGKLDATVFGTAVKGNATANKNAINSAIEWLSSIGGGTLNFKGNGNNDNPSDYPTGTIYLKDNVYLYIEEGARLHAAGGAMDWPESGWFHYYEYNYNGDDGAFQNAENFMAKQDDGHTYFQNSMFFGRRVNNIKIIGSGRIDGNNTIKKNDGTLRGGTNKIDKAIALKLCTNVEIGGINTHDNLKYDLSKADDFNTPNARPYYGKAGDDLSNMLYIDRNGHFAVLSTATDNVNVHDIFVCKYSQQESRDAFDFMANRDVYVTNIFSMASSDDIVKLGSECSMGFTRPAWNYMIRNIIGDSYCNNFQLGSETADDIQNVYVDNLIVLGSNKAGFSISANDGALVKNVNLNTGKTGPVFEDGGYIQKTNTPIFISISHRGRVIGAENYKTPAGKRAIRNVRIGHVDQVTVNNLEILEVYGGSVWDHGEGHITYDPNKSTDEYRDDEYTPVIVGYQMPAGVTAADMPDGRNIGYITNVTFNNIDLTVKGYNQNGNYTFADTERTCNELDVGQFNSRNMGVRPSYAFYVRHAQNVTFNNVSVDFEGTNGGTDDRYPFVFDDVKTASLSNVTMAKGVAANGLIQMRDSDNISMTDCLYFNKLDSANVIAVNDASGLSGGVGKENWGVYPLLDVEEAITLEANANSSYAVQIVSVGESVAVYEGTTVAELLDAVKSANSLVVKLSVVDANGNAKQGSDVLTASDKLVATTESTNASAPSAEFAIEIAAWDGVVRYIVGNEPNATLRTEPAGLIGSSSDNGSERYLEWTAENEGDAFLIDLYVPADGWYSVDMVIKKGTRATVQNYIDGVAVGEAIDLGATDGLTDVSTELKCNRTGKFYVRPLTGEIYLTRGCHTFKSEVTVASETGGVVMHSLRLSMLGQMIPGDVNRDGTVSTLDMAKLKDIILTDTTPDEGMLATGDLNHDGKLNVIDVMKLKTLLANG